MSLIAHDAHLIISAASRDQFPETDQFEVVMVGKSNVGKSSLINALCNRKKLAYVGKTPGKTRLINFYHVNEWLLLVDVPGYGFANRSKQEQINYGILMDSYFALRHPGLMLILVDSRRDISADDQLMIDFASHHQIKHAIVLTKADKLSTQRLSALRARLMSAYACSILTFSALQPSTVDPIVQTIDKQADD